MKQTHEYSSLARLAVIQHLRSYGIKIKNWNCKQRQEAGKGSSGGLQSVKVFGTPLHALPHLYVPDYGNVPGLLVDVCRYLETHIHTEGLFRKSGSVVRQKLLKAKLDSGDNSLSDAPPYDVAGILKQFFRELPDPILHADLQDAFYKAQHLSTEAERTAATMLVSCLIPDKTIHILRYFFRFLHTVSLRSDANKMDSSNLAVIFAPNLLHSNDDCEKISASTEKKLRVQALVVQTLIDQAANIGCVPDFLLEKIPGMLGIEGDAGTPVPEASEEGDGNSPGERKRRRRRSVGDFVSGALNKLKTNRTPTSTPVTDRTVLGAMVTPLILTPSTKRKLPADSVQGISNKKRKSIKHNLTFDLLPNSLFGSGSTPSSDRFEESPRVSLETSQSSLSPSVSGSKHLTSSGNLRRSKRCENRRVQRVESGKTGCFSPKISRKEMVRRSLRLRFSLGKSSKDVNSNGCPSSIRSQNIGWRLANSQELNPLPGNDKMETTPFSTKSPFVSAGSKRISKSEENLLTPKLSEGSDHRISWTGSHPLELDGMCNEGTPVAGYLCATNYYSEPVLVAGKPPAMPKNLSSRTGSYNPDQELKDDSLCEEQQNWAQNTLMRITRAFTESGSDLCMVAGVGNRLEDLPEAATISEPQTEMPHSILKHSEREKQLEGAGEYTSILKETFSARKLETAMEAETARTTDSNSVESSVTCVQTEALLIVEEKTDIPVSVAEVNCSKQEYGKENTLGICELPCESTPYPAVQESVSSEMRLIVPSPSKGTILPVPGQEMTLDMPVCKPHHPSPAVRRISRVSDHIQHFNKLCLTDHNSVKLKSPIKFERTPVRQSVRRINSLSDVKRQVNSTGLKSGTVGSTLVKSISYDGCMSSKLSLVHSNPSKHDPETNVSQEKLSATSLPEASTRIDRMFLRKSACSPAPAVNPVKSALEDLTNQGIQRITCKKPIVSANKPCNTVHSVSGSERNRYKGSPKNPISRVTFLPSSKPLDL